MVKALMTLSKETRDSSSLTIAKKRIIISLSMLRHKMRRMDLVACSSTNNSLSEMKRRDRNSITILTIIIK